MAGALRDVADLPLLPPATLAALLQLRLDNNELNLWTRLAPTVRSRVVLNDLPGVCTVETHPDGGDALVPGRAYQPAIYAFEQRDVTRPAAVDSSTTVTLTFQNMQVARDVDLFGNGMVQISLIVTNPALRGSARLPERGGPSDDYPVRLRVNVQNPPGRTVAGPDVNFVRGANDFVSLRRLYRADTARYLEPIFRELHADVETFGADPRLAWQVFSARATPDPATTAQVETLVAQLNADAYRTRESAAARLHQLGQPAAVALMHRDRSHDSPEQNSRIQALLADYRPVSDPEAVRLRSDSDFLLDCLNVDDPFIVTSALDQLRHSTTQPVVFDISWQGERRRAAVTSLREQLAGTATTAPASTPDPGSTR